ncbi:MAG TPA: 50S ribosomal protein L11 methyltransferase [Gammaproteobacteria bacterium]|nr:50S ribosomal protein L11 methyltransferase [Gammaproteobacteria bacterium]
MSRQRLTIRAAAADVPRAETLLTLAGAESISLHDAADDPVLEPEPGTAPLWPNVELRALFPEGADLGALPALLAGSCAAADITVTALDDEEWRAGIEQRFAARPIGTRLWLAPAKHAAGPPDRATVRLHMGFAFGTGEHPTTALCLDWLDTHVMAGETVLDYGCGSGILALAALALGARAAWATDNDPQALLATRTNAVLNGVTERLTVGAPEDLHAPAVGVLVANILARPLIELVPTLAPRVRPGGRLVLAGILERQAADVTAAYAPYFGGFERAAQDGWVRLAAVRKAS